MFKKPFRLFASILVVSFIIACFMPLIITKCSWFSLGVDKPNEIGDTVGGIMGPLVGFIGAIAAFLAFWIQYKANQKQFLQFDKQDTDTAIQRFENRFYESLKIHRDNVQEFEIARMNNSENSLTGRRIFFSMIEELKLCFDIVKLANEIEQEKGNVSETKYTEGQLYNISYFIFFNGVSGFDGIQANYMEKRTQHYQILGSSYQDILNKVEDIVDKVRSEYLIRKDSNKWSTSFGYKYTPPESGEVTRALFLPKIKYLPISGHNIRLGHYFRHLFQTVKYVVNADDKLFNPQNLYKDKYSYIKIVRAQLSNMEQVLLYYNAVSIFGKPWLDEKYLTDWKMVKNMPLHFANFGPLPKDILGDVDSRGEKIFEVDEIAEREIQ